MTTLKVCPSAPYRRPDHLRKADLKRIAREPYDRIAGLALADIAVNGCITKAPGGGDCAGP
jgi:hypothetical protein